MRLQSCIAYGAAMFLQWVSPAPGFFIQNPNNQDPNNQNPATHNFNRDRYQADRDGDMPTVLHQMEGVWRVEARVNSMYWGDIKQRMLTDAPTDADQPGTTRHRGGPHAFRGTNATGDPNTMRGIAEARMILDDKILGEQSYLLIDGNGSSIGQPGTDSSTSDRTSMQGLTFFGFEPDRNEYTAVFMSDRDSAIHFKSGQYDATNNRIVFEGPDRMPAMLNRNGNHSNNYDQNDPDHNVGREQRNPNPNRDNTNPASRGKDTNPPSTNSDDWSSRDRSHTQSWNGEVRVVVEILSNDKHRVTMYAGSIANEYNDPNNPQPGNPAPGKRYSNDDKNNNGNNNDQSFDPSEPLPANVVYQAVYTRTNSAEARQFQDLLRKADENNSMNRDNSGSSTGH